MHPIDRCIAEMQGYLDRGEVGWHGLASTEQQDFRGYWWELATWIADRQNAGEFEKYAPVVAKMMELVNRGQSSAPVPKAINTTTYGRET